MHRLNDAKIPGASSDTMPEMRMFITIASHRYGVSANTMNAPATNTPTTARSFRPSPGSRSMSRDASGMPRLSPITAAGSVAAPMKPRARWSRSNTCS